MSDISRKDFFDHNGHAVVPCSLRPLNRAGMNRSEPRLSGGHVMSEAFFKNLCFEVSTRFGQGHGRRKGGSRHPAGV